MGRQDTRTEDARATAPGTRTRAFDPNASELPHIPAQGATVYVGSAGVLVVDAIGDEDGTKTPFINIQGGLPVRVKKIYGAANGTTASDIVLIF